MRRISVLGFGILGLALIGCRSSSGGGTGDDDTTVDAPAKQTIQDVQNDAMPVGTPVALDGVIVTAIDAFGAKTGDFWIEEPGGGPFSGVHVFGAAASDVAALKLGDIISLSGAVKDEFALSTDTSGNTVTELEAPKGGMMTITKTGNGTVPAPAVVDALMIGQLATQAERDAQWEMWEGVLITVSKVAATNQPKCVGSACTDMTLQNFNITGLAVAESSLAAFPTGINSGDCLGSITGVVDYFFDYLILPRTTDEVVTGGTGCAVENSPAQCADGTDNDGNGFADCMDNGCIVGDSACRAVTTIPAIQAATPTLPSEIDDVFVMGIAHNKSSVWLSTSATAAANNGVFVFNSGSLDASIVPGTKVTVIGKVSEFNDDTAGGSLTEIAPLSIVASADPAATVVPVTGMTAVQLLVPATAPTFESVLVTLDNVNITAIGAATNGFVATAVQNGTTFGIGTDIIQLKATDEGCYDKITGFWTNLEAAGSAATTKPNAFGFIPLTLGTKGVATCN